MRARKNRIALVVTCILLMPGCVWADNSGKESSKPLSEKEDPRLVGKRNINKGMIKGGSLQKEVALGAQVANQVEQKAKFVDDPVIAEYINRLGQNIVLHSDAKVAFTIRVINSDDVNAFALPGGYFFVNKGLLLAADNEAELAGVMAHEIAHVAARHAMENMRKGQIIGVAATVPLILMGGGMGRVGAQQAEKILLPIAMLKFSRDAEYEADMLGAEYLWAAGYDPSALPAFFMKLEKKNQKQPGTIAGLFADHPPTPDRRVKVEALIKRFPLREEYIIDTSEFQRVKQHLEGLTNKSKHANPVDSGKPEPPTLKRRPNNPNGPDSGNPSDTTNSPAPIEDKPTLKRKNSPPNQP